MSVLDRFRLNGKRLQSLGHTIQLHHDLLELLDLILDLTRKVG